MLIPSKGATPSDAAASVVPVSVIISPAITGSSLGNAIHFFH